MKFIKKAAALFFCAALALSVMAITALADDEAVLLGDPVLNTDFVVTLVKQTATVLDRDTEPNGTANSYEINAADDITFDIKLAYNGTGEGAFTPSTDKIAAFSFVFDTSASDATTVVANSAKMSNNEPIRESTTANFYSYSSTDTGGDIALPGNSATKIGEIAFSFDSVSANTVVTPTIKDVCFYMRGTEAHQKAASDASTAAVVTTDEAVYVNPTYKATFRTFAADSNGLAKPSVTNNVEDTTEVSYTFTAGATALTDAAVIPGYDFQGWIVTTDTDSSTTWGTYSEISGGTWSEGVYFGKTDDWDAQTGSIAGVLTPVTNTTAAERNGLNINFIPKGATANSGVIPTHMVGNITLTPVYTAHTYTATFVAGNAKASFTGDSVTGLKTDSTTEREQTYTIEDLYGNAVVDFLDIGYAVATKNSTLKRTAYKFVGWTPSNTTGGTAPTSGYAWTADTAIATYNSTQVIKTASAKHYGDVTFTANWEEDIYYQEIDYQYAGANNALILVGVPKGDGANYDTNYTYKFDNNLMYVIPSTAAQRAGYVTAAHTAAESNANAAADGTVFTEANLGSDYVVFAYIAPAAESNESKVTIVENASPPAENAQNPSVAYTGDVDGDGTYAIDDCGNVNTMLANTSSTVYSISSTAGVKARLQADCSAASGTNFGSIDDILGAYNAMGYDLQNPNNQQGGD